MMFQVYHRFGILDDLPTFEKSEVYFRKILFLKFEKVASLRKCS